MTKFSRPKNHRKTVSTPPEPPPNGPKMLPKCDPRWNIAFTTQKMGYVGTYLMGYVRLDGRSVGRLARKDRTPARMIPEARTDK